MNTNSPIFLKGDDTIVNLDGMELTVGELKDHVISSAYYKKELSKLIGRSKQ